MSSLNRRFLLALPLALAACGFTPVYAPGGTGAALRGKVTIVAPESEEGYLILRNVEERLGRAQANVYRLTLTPVLERQGQAITEAGEITRFSIIGRVSYELRLTSDDSLLASGTVQDFAGYSATGSTVETLAAESDALDRLMSSLADRVTARIYTLADLPE